MKVTLITQDATGATETQIYNDCTMDQVQQHLRHPNRKEITISGDFAPDHFSFFMRDPFTGKITGTTSKATEEFLREFRFKKNNANLFLLIYPSGNWAFATSDKEDFEKDLIEAIEKNADLLH